MTIKRNLIYIVVAIFLIWCVVSFRADFAKISLSVIWAEKQAILLAAFLSLLNYGLRIARWLLFLSRLGYPLSVWFGGLTYLAGFAFTLSPGKFGELVRGRYYVAKGIPLTETAAAFFVERVMDLLAMLVLACFALAAVSAYKTLMWVCITVLILMLVCLGWIPWGRISNKVKKSEKLPLLVKNILQESIKTLLSAQGLLRPAPLVIGFLLGLSAWGAEGIGLAVIANLIPSVSMEWMVAVGIYAVSIIVGAVSFLPGGLWGTEAVMVGLLIAQGYAMPDAILLTLACRILTLWFAVALGWVAVACLRHPAFYLKKG